MNKNTKDKKIYIKFIIVCICALIGGFLCGFIGAFIGDHYSGNIVDGIQNLMSVCVPVIFIGANVIVYAICFSNYFKAKKLADEWDGWDEEVIDEAEKKLGIALAPSNILTVVNFFFYAAMMYISELGVDDLGNIEMGVLGIGVFIVSIVLMTVLQKLVIDLLKKINPEKEGNVFDTEFNKKWVDSCDEAQKQMIFEASYIAYKATNMVCMVMWAISLITMLTFDTGIFPVFCVSVIWLTLITSYTIACHKLEHKKK